MSESLLKLFIKEQLWVNRSCPSLQKCEQIAFDFFKKSDVSDFFMFEQIALKKNMGFAGKNIIFFKFFPLFMPKSRLLTVTLYKRVTVRDWLPLLMTKEPQEWFALFHEWIAFSHTKNEWFTEKTDTDRHWHNNFLVQC